MREKEKCQLLSFNANVDIIRLSRKFISINAANAENKLLYYLQEVRNLFIVVMIPKLT
jgi:hypothetical protein